MNPATPPHQRTTPSPLTLLLLAAALLAGGCLSRPKNVTAIPAERPYEAPNAAGAIPNSPAGMVPPGGNDALSSPPRQQRTGLATSFGERRESSIRPTSFRRSDSSPRGQRTLHYNDAAGLEAMMAPLWGRAVPTNAPLSACWGGDFKVGIRGEGNAWLPAWEQSGRTFVQGRAGERYAIVLVNQSKARREVVVSVDGLDVLDGQPASLRKRGYILDPGQEYAVEGFRTGPDSVAAFRFGAVSESYTQQKHGTARNVGVIGVAVFDEQDRESERRSEADPFPRTWASPPVHR